MAFLARAAGAEKLGAEKLEAYRIRGITGLSENTRIALARLGEPSWHAVSSPGQTLRTILRATCGDQGTKADAYLEKEVLRLNGGDDLDHVITAGAAAAVPFCLKVNPEVPVTVKSGDTVEGLLRKYYGVFGPKTVQQIFQMNNTEGRWGSVKQFTRRLEPGQKILLPASSQQTFVRRSNGNLATTSKALPDLLERLEGTPAAAAIQGNMTAVNPELVRNEQVEYAYVKFVSSATASQEANCGPGTAKPPFDLPVLKDRLSIEAQAAARSATARPAVVGVIDTGIGGLGGPFFGKKLFASNEAEVQGKPNEDDDSPKNGFIDDIYGMNLNAWNQNGSVKFYDTDPQRQHGTKIASLVLGGPDWVHHLDADAAPRIRLKIVNFSDASLPHTVPAIELSRAIGYLADQEADVVNMSLANAQPLLPIINAIKDSRAMLFVAAAGNAEVSVGQDLANTGVYPAGHGGRGPLGERLITVGAHANDGDWAHFSNFSSEFVDLLAPGCSIPTIDPDGNEVPEYGTSVATALVSFTAGLVRSLGENHPQELKNRLLISVDVDERLKERAWTSGRLNIIKAVSLRYDVIESVDQAAKYLFGRLADPDELRKFCDNPQTRVSLENLRKVRPNLTKNNGLFIEYWGERNDGSLWRKECRQILSNDSIGIIRVNGVETPGPPLHDVRDLVLATKPLLSGLQ
jgi:subtilisin family serine protease